MKFLQWDQEHKNDKVDGQKQSLQQQIKELPVVCTSEKDLKEERAKKMSKSRFVIEKFIYDTPKPMSSYRN